MTIILGNNHTFVKNSEIEFTNGIVKDVDELGVLADNTKVANVNGELRKPYVTSVVANYDEGTGVETLTVTNITIKGHEGEDLIAKNVGKIIK